MAAPSSTTEQHWKGDLSARKLLALVRQHNQGLRDDHALMTLLDAEAGTIDNNYEAQCTALEVAVSMDTAVEAATTTTHDGRFITEPLATDLVQQQNLRVTNLTTLIAKLNGDDGIAATNYALTALKIEALGQTGSGGVRDYGDAGSGASGALLQEISTQQAALATDWHAVAVKLDGDVGTAAAYEAALAAQVLTEA